MKPPLAGTYCTDQLETFCPRNFETVASKIQQTGAKPAWAFSFVLLSRDVAIHMCVGSVSCVFLGGSSRAI